MYRIQVNYELSPSREPIQILKTHRWRSSISILRAVCWGSSLNYNWGRCWPDTPSDGFEQMLDYADIIEASISQHPAMN
jgi:hypothetical protein